MNPRRNPLRKLAHVVRTWRALRRYRGLFTLADACLQLDRVLLPARLHYRAAGRKLAQAAIIESADQGNHRVRLREGRLHFYWPDTPTNNLWYLIEQETEPRNPHCYTTPPVALGAASLVLDVGACEGLFALRLAKSRLAARVICFEPGARMAPLLRRAALENGLAERVSVEAVAVDKQSGRVRLDETAGAEGSRIQPGGSQGVAVEAVSLDDYCQMHDLRLGPRDLIKIDAEGADLAVLEGAERVIRAGSPQIAVTTYHTDRHCFEIVDWLRQVQPAYRLRLKGFAFWTDPPRPVLLQAAL